MVVFGALRHRRGLQVPHRSRGRTATLLAVVVVGAIVVGEVAADVVNSGGAASVMSARTYATAVVPIIEESTSLLPWLTDVRTEPVSLGRLGIESALGRLVAGTTDVQQQLADLGVPAPSSRAGGYLSATFSARRQAALAVTGAIALAIGPHPTPKSAEASLLGAATDLQRSDNDYSMFIDSLPGYVTRYVSLPPSRWYEASEWDPSALTAFASLLSSTQALRVHRSLLIVAVAVEPPSLRFTGVTTTTTTSTTTSTSTTTTTTTTTTIPGAVTSSTLRPTTTTSTTTTSTTTTTTTLQVPPPGSVSWLQPTSSLSVEVVVANAGDVVASYVTVAASLTPVVPRSKRRKAAASTTSSVVATAGATADSVSHVIAALAAGGSLDLMLPPLSCRPGAGYILKVSFGTDTESLRLQVAGA